MPKHELEESRGDSYKRRRVEGSISDKALPALFERWEALSSCMDALKDKSSSSESSIVDDRALCSRLVSLSKDLLAATQTLAAQGHETERLPLDATIAVPSHASYTKWTSADIADSLPPLPGIKDAAIEKASLTHAATISGMGTSNQTYDRLEWLGDAYLELFATCFIDQTFTELDHGKCTQIREMLIRNDSLAQWTTEYGLDRRARLPPEFNLGNPRGGNPMMMKKRIKIYGDLFESYVGAVIVSDPLNGVPRAANWLKALWAKKLERHIRENEKKQSIERSNTGSDPSGTSKKATPAPTANPPKQELATLLLVKGVKLRYVDLPLPQKKDRDNNLPLFAVAVLLDGWGESGLQLGLGVAKSKSEAGHIAAQRALENKKLMKKYFEMKKTFIANQGSGNSLKD